MSSFHLFLGLLHCSVGFGSNAEARIPCCCFFLSILFLGVKRSSSLISTSFFFVFRSSKGYWLPSSLLLRLSCFFLRTQFNLLLQSRLCFECDLRQWPRGNIAVITTLPVPDCLHLVQHLQPRCLEVSVPVIEGSGILHQNTHLFVQQETPNFRDRSGPFPIPFVTAFR